MMRCVRDLVLSSVDAVERRVVAERPALLGPTMRVKALATPAVVARRNDAAVGATRDRMVWLQRQKKYAESRTEAHWLGNAARSLMSQ